MTRLVHFDIAKAIAIILVVIGHYYPENAPGWYLALHSWIYTFHMPLFMFAINAKSSKLNLFLAARFSTGTLRIRRSSR